MATLRRRRRERGVRSLIDTADEHTTIDPHTGAVRSVQAAILILPAAELDRVWNTTYLERLARTYWRFLSRASAYIVTVRYSRDRRRVVALGAIPLLTFQAPEYELDSERGVVRWRIERGVLVSRAGRGGRGYLAIEVWRLPSEAEDPPGTARAQVEVEVANFYPAISAAIGRWLYVNTQSRIHVIVTHGFLRSLERTDLARSKAGRFDRS